jgi:hypothetical protein
MPVYKKHFNLMVSKYINYPAFIIEKNMYVTLHAAHQDAQKFIV